MKVSFVNKVKFHIKKLYRKAKLPGDDSSQKMPSCTCLKASYTLEAAVIFPLVAGFFVFILFFLQGGSGGVAGEGCSVLFIQDECVSEQCK